MFLERDSDAFLVGVPGYARLELPTRNVSWKSSEFNVRSASDQFTIGGAPLDEQTFVRVESTGLDGALSEDFSLTVSLETPSRNTEGPASRQSTVDFEHVYSGELVSHAVAWGELSYGVAFSVTQTNPDTFCYTELAVGPSGWSRTLASCDRILDAAFGNEGGLVVLFESNIDGSLTVGQWFEDISSSRIIPVNVPALPQLGRDNKAGAPASISLQSDGSFLVSSLGSDGGDTYVKRIELD